MKIAIIGAGYVGLVTGIGLASLGHDVICTDISEQKINTLLSGKLPIYEQGLYELLLQARSRNRISFTVSIEKSIRESDILFICVGTPSSPDGKADLSQIRSAVKQIGRHGVKDQLIVMKSTVPVGTCDDIADFLDKNHPEKPFIDVVHNPEFLRQGNAVQDFFHPDRIIIGTQVQKAQDLMARVYESLYSTMLFCDRRSAELIKYSSNAFLAMKISFINMIAQLSDSLGINVEDVANGMGADRRIGPSFLKAGAGYGGSCFPKDIRALKEMAKLVGCKLPLLDATEKINEERPRYILQKLRDYLGDLNGRRIALLGLTFKPMTDDIRESPSLKVSRLCLEQGAYVHSFDPLVKKSPIPGLILEGSIDDAIHGSDAVVILTEWDHFLQINWSEANKKLRFPLIIDGRNLFSTEEMHPVAKDNELIYVSVGRPVIDGRQKRDGVINF